VSQLHSDSKYLARGSWQLQSTKDFIAIE